MTSLDIAMRTPRRLLVAGAAASLVATLPFASLADVAKPGSPMTHYETPKTANQESDAKTADQPDAAARAPEFSAHGTFSNICGFCHEDGGRRAGKGPQLMGTDRTDEQLFTRIKFGKPGRMAAFGGAFTDDQIKQIVVYIRNLKPR